MSGREFVACIFKTAGHFMYVITSDFLRVDEAPVGTACRLFPCLPLLSLDAGCVLRCTDFTSDISAFIDKACSKFCSACVGV